MRVNDDNYLSAPVLAFAFEMQRQLDENSHKGNSYREMSARQLLKRVREEVGELERAVRKLPAKNRSKYITTQQARARGAIDMEAADVANFCAFLSEKYGSGGFEYDRD